MQGFEVVGYDISQLYLDKARRYADKMKVTDKIGFCRGDFRQVESTLRSRKYLGFQVIIDMLESQGFYGEEGDIQLFKQLRRISGDGCVLILQALNRDFLVKNFYEHAVHEVTPRMVLHERLEFNYENSVLRNNWKFYSKGSAGVLKPVLEVTLEARVYSLHELRRILTESGWENLESYADIRKLDKPGPERSTMVMVARRMS